jgi:hypothetical protein
MLHGQLTSRRTNCPAKRCNRGIHYLLRDSWSIMLLSYTAGNCRRSTFWKLIDWWEEVRDQNTLETASTANIYRILRGGSVG